MSGHRQILAQTGRALLRTAHPACSAHGWLPACGCLATCCICLVEIKAAPLCASRSVSASLTSVYCSNDLWSSPDGVHWKQIYATINPGPVQTDLDVSPVVCFALSCVFQCRPYHSLLALVPSTWLIGTVSFGFRKPMQVFSLTHTPTRRHEQTHSILDSDIASQFSCTRRGTAC